jgi:hypothetical protein
VSEAEDRGFGIHVSAAEWEKIKPIYDRYNQAHEWFRVPAAADAEDGRRQIGVCVFEYGGNKTKNDSTNDDALTSGWWNCAKFQVQVKFLVECFDILYGDTRQLLLQVDRSSGHMSKGPQARVANTINFSDGGLVKGVPRKGFEQTKVQEQDFGEHWPRDSTNKIQFGNYPVEDDPERYDNVGPHYDNKQGTFDFKVPDNFQPGQALSITTLQNAPAVRCIPAPGTKPGDTLIIDMDEPGKEWWRGLAKGKAQLLYETGHIDPTLTKPSSQWINAWANGYKPTAEEVSTKTHQSTGKKNAELWLAARDDFRNQPTVIERDVLAAGHLLIASPRYHPEMAGGGIEYCWGKAKWCFRRHVNDLEGKNLERNILIALGDRPYRMHGQADGEWCAAPLPVQRVRKFARRARTYRMLFAKFPNKMAATAFLDQWKQGHQVGIVGGDISIPKADKNDGFTEMISKMYKTVKTHCNIIDVDWRVCTRE